MPTPDLQPGMNQLDKAERYLRQSLEYDAEITALLSMASLNYQNGAFLNARDFCNGLSRWKQPTHRVFYWVTELKWRLETPRLQ
jgi:Tfp pilus assembly protein PilF